MYISGLAKKNLKKSDISYVRSLNILSTGPHFSKCLIVIHFYSHTHMWRKVSNLLSTICFPWVRMLSVAEKLYYLVLYQASPMFYV